MYRNTEVVMRCVYQRVGARSRELHDPVQRDPAKHEMLGSLRFTDVPSESRARARLRDRVRHGVRLKRFDVLYLLVPL